MDKLKFKAVSNFISSMVNCDPSKIPSWKSLHNMTTSEAWAWRAIFTHGTFEAGRIAAKARRGDNANILSPFFIRAFNRIYNLAMPEVQAKLEVYRERMGRGI